MNSKDCCCFCFSAKTGVKFVPILIAPELVIEIIALIVGSKRTEYGFYWFPMVDILFALILSYKYYMVIRNEGRYNDYETRLSFYRFYMVLYIIATPIWQLLTYIATMNKIDPSQRSGYSLAFWPIFLFFWIMNIYCCYVSKLYTDLGISSRRGSLYKHLERTGNNVATQS